jgi:hypothetical protein
MWAKLRDTRLSPEDSVRERHIPAALRANQVVNQEYLPFCGEVHATMGTS